MGSESDNLCCKLLDVSALALSVLCLALCVSVAAPTARKKRNKRRSIVILDRNSDQSKHDRFGFLAFAFQRASADPAVEM